MGQSPELLNCPARSSAAPPVGRLVPIASTSTWSAEVSLPYPQESTTGDRVRKLPSSVGMTWAEVVCTCQWKPVFILRTRGAP